MKRILTITITAIAISFVATSCNKEYSCECDNFSVIVEAPTQTEAESTCSTKGTNCDIR